MQGFGNRDGSILFEIIGDHDVSLAFTVFPDRLAHREHISPSMSLASGYIGRSIPHFLSRQVGRVV